MSISIVLLQSYVDHLDLAGVRDKCGAVALWPVNYHDPTTLRRRDSALLFHARLGEPDAMAGLDGARKWLHQTVTSYPDLAEAWAVKP